MVRDIERAQENFRPIRLRGETALRMSSGATDAAAGAALCIVEPSY